MEIVIQDYVFFRSSWLSLRPYFLQTIVKILEELESTCKGTPPDTTTTYKWVCEQWERELVAANLETITATFREVYEP